MISVEFGRFTGKMTRTFSDYRSAVEYARTHSDDFHQGFIRDENTGLLHVHKEPYKGWEPPLPTWEEE